jgi:cell division protein FtsI (penicillin-binding protein 3)
VLSETAANQLRQMLVSVTEEGGTGTKAGMPGYKLAGKTGTAKKHVPGYGYMDGRYVVSFAGFFPADDPKLLGLVVVDDPHAEDMHIYGGTVAAPIFKAMALKAVQTLGIPPVDAEEYRLAEFGSEPQPAPGD